MEPVRDPDVALVIRPKSKRMAPRDQRRWQPIGITLYDEDLAEVDAIVARLKKMGIRRVNRSRVIRIALRRLEVGRLIAELTELK